jgi:hypothetical protein
VEPREALSVAAQIAVALAGFAGVVVAFRSGPLHEWSVLDKLRLWLLLGNSLVPLFNWFSFLGTIPFGILSRRRQLDLGPTGLKEVGSYRYLFYTIGILGMAVGLL